MIKFFSCLLALCVAAMPVTAGTPFVYGTGNAATVKQAATGCPCTLGKGNCGQASCPSNGGQGCGCQFDLFVFGSVKKTETVVTPVVVTPAPFVQYSPASTPGTTVRGAGPPNTSYTVSAGQVVSIPTSARGAGQFGSIKTYTISSGGCANGQCGTPTRTR